MATKTRNKTTARSGGSTRSQGRSGSQSRSQRSGSRAGSSRGTAARSAGSRTANARGTASRGSTSRRAPTTGTGARGSTSRLSKITTDHEEIREWAEARGAQPACVKGTGRSRGDMGMIRLDFPGFSGAQSLKHITWDEWFDAFDNNQLALVYQDKTATGRQSNFNKLIARE